jgi:hypothetical protein
VADAAVSLNVLEAFDITGDDSLQITFDVVVRVDFVAELFELSLSEVFDTLGTLNAGSVTDILGKLWTDAVDIGQADLDLLFSRDGNVRNSRHAYPCLCLFLGFFLLMT